MIVVLLGPPGAGKSTIARALCDSGFRWRDWEQWLVDEYGSREGLLAAKTEALPRLHAAMREWFAATGDTPVVESTGLSDAAFLDSLDDAFVVRCDVPLDVALARIAARPDGANLTNDVAHNEVIWREFQAGPAGRQADLVIDTSVTSASDACARIAAAVSAGD